MKSLSKALSLSVIGAVIGSAAYAQTPEDQTPGTITSQPEGLQERAPAVEGPLGISAQVGAGTRGLFEGTFTGSEKDSNEVGPYVAPEFALDYGQDNIDIALSYYFEAFGGNGFGDKKEKDGNESFGSNSYFYHNPTLIIGAKVSPDWNVGLLVDSTVKQYLSDDRNGENDFYIAAIPEVTYDIDNSTTVGLGYFLEHTIKMNTSVGFGRDDKNNSLVNSKLASTEANEVAAALTTATQRPTSTKHTGRAIMKNKIAKGVSASTYIRYGKLVTNGLSKNDAYSYRFNTDWTITPTEALSLALRYRIDLTDYTGADEDASFYNRGRLIATYTLTDEWSAELASDNFIFSSTTPGAKNEFASENYAGLAYTF